ncbi:inorganic phosphate transporter, PiT family [Filimonas lacunae]|uniref:Inorganic phosphate transporter, PiT family n=1 Tax=Filimonas lacunae TaxID=477680 RepID=A0A173MPG8_9BACT|nr:inorganic phosphate transporter [Filimonas lacunae]BAV09258.1 low-affinity inorganic phosphate transporter [Filimonas lacunae]SIS69940.1 inorganic phosphate transporter, PiT family [Filimonas lacunae]
MVTLLIVIVVLSFVFDYINGFHDAANSIATIVSTKVLTPFQAVLWAAFFNFGAFFISKYVVGHFGIADTIAKSVTLDKGDPYALYVILAGLISAIAWNLITWWFGIPSSSSHALIGGLIGAAVARYKTLGVVVAAKVIPIILFIFAAPLIGMIIAFIITIIIVHLCKRGNPYKTEKWFKRLQLVSSGLFSLGHGSNDAQKVMGIIGAAMVASHYIPDLGHIPDWVPIMCFVAIGLGTMSGGWKIVKTMGTRITKVTPLEGVAAETAGAITLFLTEHFKIPVSTTHTITGSIIGVGATKRLSAVRWGVTINLVWAWVLTIPVSAIFAAIAYYILVLFK